MTNTDDRFFLARDPSTTVSWPPAVPITHTSWTADGLKLNDIVVDVQGSLFRGVAYSPLELPVPLWDVEVVRCNHPEGGVRLAELVIDIYIHVRVLASLCARGGRIPGRKLLMKLCRRQCDVESHRENYLLHDYGTHTALPLHDTTYDSTIRLLKQPTISQFQLSAASIPKLQTELFDFQRRAVAMMHNIENSGRYFKSVHRRYARLAAGGAEVFIGKQSDIYARDECEQSHVTIQGGMLCDNMGMGKTLSMIALTMCNTGPTLVICPSHIVGHWCAEIRRHLDNIHVFSLVSIADTKRVNMGKLGRDSICVLSFALLNNKTFRERDERYAIAGGPLVETKYRLQGMRRDHDKMPEIEQANQPFHPFLFDWHRVIVDEFHDLSQPSNASAVQYIPCISAVHKWLLSGTPDVNIMSNINFLYKFFFGEHEFPLEDALHALVSKCVVKNREYSITLPDVVQHVRWVKFSTEERQIYDAVGPDGRAQQLRVCAYPRLANVSAGTHVQEVDTVDQMRIAAISHLQRRIEKVKASTDILVTRLCDVQNITPQHPHERMRTRVQQLRRELGDEIERQREQLTIWQSAINYVNNSECTDCVVCLDKIDTPALLKSCGHHLCRACALQVYSRSRRCPSCRAEISANDIITLSPRDNRNQLQRQYGSKLSTLISIIRDTPTIKTLIFSQFDELLRDVGKCLEKSCHVLYCRGNVMQKRSSIERFAKSTDHNLLLLSTLNSGSGCDLSMATRVIMLDTVDLSHEEVRGIETQAISRCHRIGQTKTVSVLRLLVRDTIEQEIYERVYATDNHTPNVQVSSS